MENGNIGFNFEKVFKLIQNGPPLLGKEIILNPLIKQLSKSGFATKIDAHLAQELSVNRRYGLRMTYKGSRPILKKCMAWKSQTGH